MYFDLNHVFSKSIIPKIISFIFAVLIILQIFFITKDIYLAKTAKTSNFSNTFAHSNHNSTTTAQHTKQQTNLKTPIFGNYFPKNIKDTTIKKSMLDLKIVGIIFADIDEESEVILHMQDGKDKVFKTGDKLPSGIMIGRIMPQGILVHRNGTLERLNFPAQELAFNEQPLPLLTEDE